MGFSSGLSELQAEICNMAMRGIRPVQIQERLAGRATRGTIGQAIRNGRDLGMPIPYFVTPARSETYRYVEKWEPQSTKAEIPPLTIEEKARLADCARRGVGVTSIAAMLRQPYAVVIAELDRQKLSRAGG